MIDSANCIIDDLIRSPSNLDIGLHVVVDKAMNNPPVLNIDRPANIRKYFGAKVEGTKLRYTYPKTTLVGGVPLGTDPSNFVTRPMTDQMCYICDVLRKIMINNRSILNLDGVNLDNTFNHMTLLT